MAMLAASTLTCTSLSKSVTQAWCVSVCENGLHFCPPNVCQCEKKAGFGGDETTWPTATNARARLPRAASGLNLLETTLGRTHASAHAKSTESDYSASRIAAKQASDAKSAARAEADIAERAAEKAGKIARASAVASVPVSPCPRPRPWSPACQRTRACARARLRV